MKNIESKFNEAFKKGNVYRPLDWSVFNNYFPSLNGYALDFGAGRGDSSLFLAKLGLKVDAIDFSKEAFKQRIKHKNINYILGSNIPDKKYDFILLKHVIAFIKDKKKFIEILKSHLKKNGKLLIVTPVKRKNYNQIPPKVVYSLTALGKRFLKLMPALISLGKKL